MIQVKDKHDTSHLVVPLQQALLRAIPGARVDVKQLDTGTPIKFPVSIRLTGEDAPTLRRLAAELEKIYHSTPLAERCRNNWGSENLVARLQIDPDRANLSGGINLDVSVGLGRGQERLLGWDSPEGRK